MSRSRHRRAFGLIELLVVIAILALLAGLLVPAVQRVRQSASRLQTMNNLKQCALAVHAYHDNYKKMPNAFGKDAIQNDTRTLWFQLLPFVEANNVYTNDAADTTAVPPYIAPDDLYDADAKGRLNYSANMRVFGYQTYGGQACNNVGAAMKVKDEKTMILSGLRLNTIPDGTTNTIMLSTRMASCNRNDKGDPVYTKINGDPGTPQGGFFGVSEISQRASPLFAVTPNVPYQEAPKDFDELPVGQSRKCINNASAVPHSFAGRGLATALCDGSCRYIDTKMSVVTFGRALSPGDGNAMDADWNDD